MEDKKEPGVQKEIETKKGWSLTPGFKALLIVCVAYALCWVTYVQWQGAIATHMQELNISLRHYSLLWTINGAMIVCAQPLVSMLIRWMKRSLKQQIMIESSFCGVIHCVKSSAAIYDVPRCDGKY